MSMSYQIRDYFILTDTNEIRHTNATQTRKYNHYIVLRSDITHRETQKHFFHYDCLLTTDVSNITEDVMQEFIERCKERCDAGGFEINYIEVSYQR